MKKKISEMSVFISSKNVSEKPVGAIEVRKDQVAAFYEVVVETWENKNEIWALSYGAPILGVAGALSGWYGNAYFRKRLKLRNFGFFSTYLPNTVLPFLIVSGIQATFVQRNIYLDPYGCSLCKGTRAAVVQVGLGMLQPLILVPASSLLFATRHFTYRIPSPIHNRREFLKFLIQLYKPLKIPMGINVALQIMIAFFITHVQENQFFYLQNAIVKSDGDPEELEGTVDL